MIKMQRTTDCVVPNPNISIKKILYLGFREHHETGMEGLYEPEDQEFFCNIVFPRKSKDKKTTPMLASSTGLRKQDQN